MQVHAINYTNKPIQTILPRLTPVKPGITEPSRKTGISQPYFTGMISSKEIEKGFAEYRWFIDHDKLPAINSLLKIDTSKECFENLTCKILNDNGMSYELIDSIIRQPRNIKYFLKDFEQKLPRTSEVLLTFFPKNVYRQAYTRYIETRMKNATSISELLQIRPDWKGDVLLKKHQEIYHNDDFELGFVPDEINRANLQGIIDYLKPYMDSGFKLQKEITPLHINGKTFNFHFFTDGKTDKNVFLICDEHGNKFVIKIAPEARSSLDAPFAMGTLCKIDTYLTRNYCRNSAPLRYYNHKLNASIYDFIEHKRLVTKPSSQEISQSIPDFVDLGMKYNDTVGSNNFFLLDSSQNKVRGMNDFQYGVNKKEWITVDNDHVTYECRLQPKLPEYHTHLPNNMQMFF